MVTPIFLWHCDPVYPLKSSVVLALINLHALLFEQPLVFNDNFLISRRFLDITENSPKKSFLDSFRNGYLQLTLRDTDFSVL